MWACEALARKLVAYTPLKEQYGLLSARFTVLDDDGDETLPTSALESAVDQQCTFFLSSNESQRCVFALWKGLLVQTEKEGGQIDYELYDKANGATTLEHFDPQRLSVPRYQSVLAHLATPLVNSRLAQPTNSSPPARPQILLPHCPLDRVRDRLHLGDPNA